MDTSQRTNFAIVRGITVRGITVRGITLTALALSLGACRGVPQANSGSDGPAAPTYDASAQVEWSPSENYSEPTYDGDLNRGAVPDSELGYGTTDQLAPPLHVEASWSPVEQGSREHAPHERAAPDSAPSRQVSFDAPTPNSAPPSPALPRSSDAQRSWAMQASHGGADFTPNVARVGHVASLPPTLPPYGGVDGMHCCNDPFYPPEIWPLRKDEFLCDGGDKRLHVEVDYDWTVRGLDLEDTVVHYDTLAGDTNVEPSNCICIYAPRFAAVRKTVGLAQTRLRQKSGGVDHDAGVVLQEEVAIASTVLQPLQPGRNIGIDQPITFAEDERPGEVGRLRLVAGLENGFMPYENLQFIRAGVYEQSEKARLAESIEAAIAWTHNHEVEVLVNNRQPAVQESVLEVDELAKVEPVGTPRMRICKLASRHDALPGETVYFTLRFDNTGTQRVGNVTIIDNLTTRLEYVPGTAECSLDANFITTENEGESLVLRWEIIEPLEPGQGGIIRFQCRVR